MSYYSEAEHFYDREEYEKAYELYKLGAKAGDVKCYYGIAMLHNQEYIDEADFDLGEKLFKKYIPKIKKLAVAGDYEASCIMYWNYSGTGRPREGFKWLELAANQGSVWAQYKVACVYLIGWCPENCDDCSAECSAYQPKDISKAFRYFSLAAENGHARSQYFLGKMYEKYDEIGIDLQMAKKWYTIAASNGDESAAQRLKAIIASTTFEHEQKNNLKAYITAAENGNIDAQWHLANMYYHGDGVQEDKTEGVKWAFLAATAGNVEAQFLLCFCYLTGTGVDKSLDEAIKWCSRAAAQGHQLATQSLDELKYEKLCQRADPTQDCSKDDIQLLERMSAKGEVGANSLLNNARLARARSLSKKSEIECLSESISSYEALAESAPNFNIIIDKELPIVYYKLATVYDIEQLDFSTALKYYIKADEGGYYQAKFNIAMLYYDGDNSIKNYSKAIYNFKKCTELGIEEGKSHYYLGSCFYWGLGVPVDMELAKKHYISAYEYGFNCNYAIDTVSSELGGRIGESSMQKYAESIKKLNLSDEKLAIRINKDLISDFGGTWEKLSDNSRRSLATAMETYVHIYCKGPHKYGNYDFSGVVGGMCRALEIELERCLYTGYIKYLKENDVSPNSFEGTRSFLKRISANDCAYDEKTSNFTLGAIYPTIGEGKKSGNIIDSSMIDYLDFVFKNDAFNEGERRVAITNYILSLADSVYTIAEQHRNAAAHTEVIKCWRAEICGDYIIKAQKLLCKFIEKLW